MTHNSTSAIDYINNEEPDLIILDIWLKDSEMDGIEILKSVRQNNPLCPVVVISGHGNIEIAVAAVKQGAYDFIEKPFNTDQLLLVIDRALETSRLRKEVFSLQNKEINESKMVGGTGAFKILKQNSPLHNPFAINILSKKGPLLVEMLSEPLLSNFPFTYNTFPIGKRVRQNTKPIWSPIRDLTFIFRLNFILSKSLPY